MANKVSINLSQAGFTLNPGSSYRVAIDSGFVSEVENNRSPNPANSNLLSFNTFATGPTLISYNVFPASTSSFVTSIDLYYSVSKLNTGTGVYSLYRVGSPSVVSTFSSASAIGTNTYATINLSSLTFLDNTKYYITASAGVVEDLFGVESPAITSTSTITFNVDYISNMTDRNYLTNNMNNLFETNTPQILDTFTGTYTISLTCSNGVFGINEDGSGSTSTWSYTGTKSVVNSIFSQIKFWPTKNYSSNTTFNYTQTRAGGVTVNRTINLLAVASSYSNVYTYVLSSTQYSTSTFWTPSFTDLRYNNGMDVLLVGSGGAGGTIDSITISGNPNGGGGGAGGLAEYFGLTVTNKTYNLSIGPRGHVYSTVHPVKTTSSVFVNGGSTVFDSYTIGGGQTAPFYGSVTLPNNYYGYNGGNSGSPQSNSGGTGGLYRNGGGGGVGAATTSQNGGVGVLSTITNQRYGGGGAGYVDDNFLTNGTYVDGGGKALWSIPSGPPTYATDGTDGTGGGGGAGSVNDTPYLQVGLTGYHPSLQYVRNLGYYPYNTGIGGSGVVVIKVKS